MEAVFSTIRPFFYFDLPTALIAALYLVVEITYIRHKTAVTWALIVEKVIILAYSLVKAAGIFLRSAESSALGPMVGLEIWTNLGAHLLHGLLVFGNFLVISFLTGTRGRQSWLQRGLFFAPTAALLLTLVLPGTRALLYRIEPDGRYVHGSLHGLFVADVVIYLVMIFVLSIRRRQELGHKYRLIMTTNAGYALSYVIDQALSIRTSNFVMALNLIILASVLEAEASERWRSVSLRDPLTGLRNRAACAGDIPGYLDKEICVAMLDVDRFKHFNDSYGHRSGDLVLREVGAAIRELFGEGGYRYGGDEFLILSRMTPSAFVTLLGRLQADVRSLSLPDVHEPVGISCGCCHGTAQSPAQFLQLIARADQCLYRAKREGIHEPFCEREEGEGETTAAGDSRSGQ